jgi:hypothetical protein
MVISWMAMDDLGAVCCCNGAALWRSGLSGRSRPLVCLTTTRSTTVMACAHNYGLCPALRDGSLQIGNTVFRASRLVSLANNLRT